MTAVLLGMIMVPCQLWAQPIEKDVLAPPADYGEDRVADTAKEKDLYGAILEAEIHKIFGRKISEVPFDEITLAIKTRRLELGQFTFRVENTCIEVEIPGNRFYLLPAQPSGTRISWKIPVGQPLSYTERVMLANRPGPGERLFLPADGHDARLTSRSAISDMATANDQRGFAMGSKKTTPKKITAVQAKVDQHFGSRLRKLREAGGWSQTQFGKMVGVSQTLVSNFETGKLLPFEHEVQQLAKALGVSVAFLEHGERQVAKVDQYFGQRIRGLRQDRGLSQSELGILVGLSQTQISNLERGQIQPSVDEVAGFARAFDVAEINLVRAENVKKISKPRKTKSKEQPSEATPTGKPTDISGLSDQEKETIKAIEAFEQAAQKDAISKALAGIYRGGKPVFNESHIKRLIRYANMGWRVHICYLLMTYTDSIGAEIFNGYHISQIMRSSVASKAQSIEELKTFIGALMEYKDKDGQEIFNGYHISQIMRSSVASKAQSIEELKTFIGALMEYKDKDGQEIFNGYLVSGLFRVPKVKDIRQLHDSLKVLLDKLTDVDGRINIRRGELLRLVRWYLKDRDFLLKAIAVVKTPGESRYGSIALNLLGHRKRYSAGFHAMDTLQGEINLETHDLKYLAFRGRIKRLDLAPSQLKGVLALFLSDEPKWLDDKAKKDLETFAAVDRQSDADKAFQLLLGLTYSIDNGIRERAKNEWMTRYDSKVTGLAPKYIGEGRNILVACVKNFDPFKHPEGTFRERFERYLSASLVFARVIVDAQEMIALPSLQAGEKGQTLADFLHDPQLGPLDSILLKEAVIDALREFNTRFGGLGVVERTKALLVLQIAREGGLTDEDLKKNAPQLCRYEAKSKAASGRLGQAIGANQTMAVAA